MHKVNHLFNVFNQILQLEISLLSIILVEEPESNTIVVHI